jgi:hypothetical protein
MPEIIREPGYQNQTELLTAVKNELLEALCAEYSLPEIDLIHEVTASMIANRTGQTVNKVKGDLDGKVKEGELICRQVFYRKHRTTAYRKVDS